MRPLCRAASGPWVTWINKSEWCMVYTDGQIEALELFMYLPQLSLYRVDKKRGHLVLRLTTNVHKIGTKFGTSRICIILNIIYLNQLWKIKWHHIVNMTISNR